MSWLANNFYLLPQLLSNFASFQNSDAYGAEIMIFFPWHTKLFSQVECSLFPSVKLKLYIYLSGDTYPLFFESCAACSERSLSSKWIRNRDLLKSLFLLPKNIICFENMAWVTRVNLLLRLGKKKKKISKKHVKSEEDMMIYISYIQLAKWVGITNKPCLQRP